MKKNQPVVLVLGASLDQLYLIQTAKAMGCYVVAVDMNPAAAAFDYVDDKAVVSTRDIDGLISFVRSYTLKRPINAVVTMGSDIPMSVAVVADELGLPAVSRQTALLASNKLLMKRHWKEKGISIPWFDELVSSNHLKEIIKKRGWNLIVKPSDRSGARGITKLSEGMDCDEVFQKAKQLSYEGKVIVEEFIGGEQESTESIVYGDFFKTAGVSDRNYDMMDKLKGAPIENGGTMPSVLSREKLEDMDRLLEKAARALGITHGVAKGDVVFNAAGKPVMIEMAARLSGGWMSSGLIPITTGVNIVETILEISLGLEPDLKKLEPKFHKHSALRYFFPPAGSLTGIEGLEQAREFKWLKGLEFYKNIGEIVGDPSSHADRVGGFILEGCSRQDVLGKVELVYNTVRIITKPL